MSDIIAGSPAPTNPDQLYPVTEAAEQLLRSSGYGFTSLAALAKRALRSGVESGEIPCRRIDGRMAFAYGDLQLASTIDAFTSWLKVTSGEEARERLAADKAKGAAEAAAWNETYPIGTLVMAYPGVRPEHPAASMCTRLETKTRSRAWNLGHGEPVVAVEGYSGGIVLSHIDVIADGSESRG